MRGSAFYDRAGLILPEVNHIMRENLVRKIDELPPEIQMEVEGFVEFPWVKRVKKKSGKPSFSWAGGLKELNEDVKEKWR